MAESVIVLLLLSPLSSRSSLKGRRAGREFLDTDTRLLICGCLHAVHICSSLCSLSPFPVLVPLLSICLAHDILSVICRVYVRCVADNSLHKIWRTSVKPNGWSTALYACARQPRRSMSFSVLIVYAIR